MMDSTLLPACPYTLSPLARSISYTWLVMDWIQYSATGLVFPLIIQPPLLEKSGAVHGCPASPSSRKVVERLSCRVADQMANDQLRWAALIRAPSMVGGFKCEENYDSVGADPVVLCRAGSWITFEEKKRWGREEMLGWW